MMAADPADISVLHMAFYLRSGGGLRYLNAFEGGAQQDRVDGGAHQLAERLAAGLDVRFVEPVTAIRDTARNVVVATPSREHRADAVVVALPPVLADSIDYHPVPPQFRSTIRTAPGCAVKVHLVFPEPAWRARGLSGWSVNAKGPLLSTVDDSPAGRPVGVLTGFVTGAEAHRFAALPPEEQRSAARAQARELFPELPDPSRCTSRTGSTTRTRAAATRRCSGRATGCGWDPRSHAARARALGRDRDQRGVLRPDGGRDPVRAAGRRRDPRRLTRPGSPPAPRISAMSPTPDEPGLPDQLDLPDPPDQPDQLDRATRPTSSTRPTSPISSTAPPVPPARPA